MQTDQVSALLRDVADRLVVLRLGVMQQFGTPEEVYDYPANAYVAGFMGYRNLLQLDVVNADAERVSARGNHITLVGANRESVTGGRAILP